MDEETSNRFADPFKDDPKLENSDMKRRNILICGLICATFSGICFGGSCALVKKIEHIDPAQVTVYQYLFISVLTFPVFIKKGGLKQIFSPPDSTKYTLFVCGCLDAVTAFSAYKSYKYLNLAHATVLTSCVPILVTILAWMLLKEPIGKIQGLALIFSVVGVLLVSKIHLMMEDITDFNSENLTGICLALGSAAAEAGSYIATRKVEFLNCFVTLFCLGFLCTFLDAAITAICAEFSVPPDKETTLMLVSICVLSFLCQITITYALTKDPAGAVSVVMSAGDVLTSFILESLMFHEPMDAFTVAGAVLVMAGVLLIWYKHWLIDRGTGEYVVNIVEMPKLSVA